MSTWRVENLIPSLNDHGRGTIQGQNPEATLGQRAVGRAAKQQGGKTVANGGTEGLQTKTYGVSVCV